MRAVIQRVKQSCVFIKNELVSEIGPGLLILLGVSDKDRTEDADYLADKIINLRIFEDDSGKMNRSLIETRQEIMVVSQFTLFADCRKGRRPSFTNAAPPEKAETFYQYFVDRLFAKGISVKTGVFRAMMDISLINDGPVTIIIDSKP